MVNQTLIGAIRAEATLESGKFVDGARKMRLEAVKTEGTLKKSFGNIGGILAAGIGGFIGALGSGLILQGIRQALEYASSLKEISQQLGVTTKDLQVLRFAAGQLGVKQQDLETGLKNLTKTLGQVAAGAERPRKALEAIGITAKELAGLDTGAAFRKIADALEQIPDRAQRAAIEVALFGERGQRLDTLLSGGSSAINQLAAAAEELGIVLSDAQIQKADETADKLEAIKTVLSARLAGVVADNADAILKLAEALAEIADIAIKAAASFGHFVSTVISNPFTRGALLIAGGQPVAGAQTIANAIVGGGGARGNSVTLKLPPPKPLDAGGRDIGRFLAPKPRAGRGSRGRTSRAPRDRSDDVTFEFAREQRQADMDILRAKRELARTAEERLALDLQLLDLQQQDFEAELANRVRRAERDAAEGRITQSALEEVKAQAAILSAKNAEKVELERQALVEADQARLAEEEQRLREVDFELQEEALRAQIDLAETAAERRDLELRLLDLVTRQERARLEAAIADEQSSEAAKEEARRRLAMLNTLQASRQQSVIADTRGPMESWIASLPNTAEKAEEAMQSLTVNGIEGAIDALLELRHGFESFRDAAIRVLDEVIAQLIRLQIMKMIAGIAGGASGTVTGEAAFAATAGIPGFAAGGSMILGGMPGFDKNVLALNGLPIARVSYGERLSFSNDNGGGSMVGGGITVNAPITIQGNASRETMEQAATAIRRRVASVAQKGLA